MRLIAPFRHVLPVSDFFFHQPLYVSHAGWERIDPGKAYSTARGQAEIFYQLNDAEGRILPGFNLVLIVAGQGEFQVGRDRGEVEAGEAFLYLPGEWHRHHPSLDTGWAAMWFHFDGSEPHQWLQDNLFNVRNHKPVIENYPLLRDQFERLLECIHRNPTGNSENLSRQAMGILSHILLDKPAGSPHGADHVTDEVVKVAMEYIWNFNYEILDVPEVARKAGVNRRTLERRFKAAIGRGVLEEIQYCRISRAASLLQETTSPIKHIVHRAGFRSEQQLRLAFRKAFGVSAKAYRAAHAIAKA